MSNGRQNSVESIVASGLCVGCGTCVGVCPNSALRIAKDTQGNGYIAKLIAEKCTDCSLCLNICPSHAVDFRLLNTAPFHTESQDVLLGNYGACYIGYAIDSTIRYQSASGGLVTALLLFALENGLIDGAIVTRMNETSPLEPQVFVARSRDDIISASKSKYCPVPTNIALKDIILKDGKFAIVGLPCHMRGIRRYEMFHPGLQSKIALHLGLFCSNTPGFLATEYLLHQISCKSSNILNIEYRGNGWPGSMRIKLSPRLSLSLPSYWNTGFGQYFSSIGCMLCSDQTNELADISFGDAWLPEIMREDRIGTSIVVSRNKIGQYYLEKAVLGKVITLHKIDRRKLLESQGGIWSFKKTNQKTRYMLLRVFDEKVEMHQYHSSLPRLRSIDYIRITFRLLGRRIASKRSLWRFLRLYHDLSGAFQLRLERVLCGR